MILKQIRRNAEMLPENVSSTPLRLVRLPHAQRRFSPAGRIPTPLRGSERNRFISSLTTPARARRCTTSVSRETYSETENDTWASSGGISLCSALLSFPLSLSLLWALRLPSQCFRCFRAAGVSWEKKSPARP